MITPSPSAFERPYNINIPILEALCISSMLLLSSLTSILHALTYGAQPTVKLDLATVTGIESGNTTRFLGIPFGKAP